MQKVRDAAQKQKAAKQPQQGRLPLLHGHQQTRIMQACDGQGLMGCMQLKAFRFLGLLFLDLL